MRRRALGSVALALALSACSTPRSSHPTSPSVSPSVSYSPYVDVPSESTTPTTAAGTDLALGRTAVAWWKPSAGSAALLHLRVTAIHRTTFKRSFKGWKLTKATLATTPYFVTASVSAANALVAGKQVPLYALDDRDQLVQASSFKQAFKPCGPGVFPVGYTSGRAARVCLVYLVPKKAKLEGIAYRPAQTLQPITWKGPVTALPVAKSGKKKHKS